MSRAWYLLHCKPGQAGRAVEHLGRQGYTTYLPLILTERLRRQQRCLVEEPLFGGYLFILLDAVFHCFDGEQRALILLTLLQRDQLVTVPLGHLQKVT